MKFFNRTRQRGGTKVKAQEKPPVLDNKTLLKYARQCIDGGNFNEAKRYCKKVLRKDKDNYMALVLLGKSFETAENAVIIYKKAIQIRPEYPLAWQGLANYYERKKEVAEELLDIYEKILILQNIDEDYAIKTLQKYRELSINLNNTKSISTLMQFMRKPCSDKLTKTAEKQFLEILKTVPCMDEDLSEAIQYLINFSAKDPQDERFQIILGKLIFQKSNFSDAVKEVIELDVFSGSKLMKEVVCEELCRKFINNDSFDDFEVENYINELTGGIEGTRFGGFLIAIMLFRNGSFVQAFKKCTNSIKNADIALIPESIFLLKCSKFINDVTVVENLTSSLLRNPYLDDPEFIYIVNITLISVYLEHNRCYEAINVLKNIPIEKINAELVMHLGNMYCEKFLHLNLITSILASTDYLELFKVFDHLKYKRYDDAITILLSYSKHPIKYYYLSYAYWQNKQHTQCLESLQRALELLPNIPKIYFCLGIYYYEHANNIEEGRKYLETCYRMCKTDIETIKVLSVIYDQLKLTDLELNLLQDSIIIARRTKQFWIYTRLGRLHFVKGNADDAVIWLHESIKVNPKDLTAHEWLGDSFFKLQSYRQAIAAYEKVVQITNNPPLIIKCSHKIGCIYTLQKLYDQAVFVYTNILRVEPDNLLAVRGVTKNRLIQAQKHLSEYSYSAAREEVQEAINHILKAMLMGITSTIYWHLFGDALLFISRLPNEYCFIKMRNARGETLKNGKIVMFQMAIESFSNVAKLRDSLALYKCAYTYLLCYFETKRISFCHTSYNLAVLCVKNNSNAWLYWDLLGKVCYFSQKYEFAHYSFLRAISLNEDKSVSIVWCNLGVLYIKIDKERLANYCFTVGRDSLPSYPRTWIGDGLLAEIIQEEGNIGVFTPAPNSNFELLNDDYVDWLALINEMSSQQNEPTFSSPIEAFRLIPNSIEIVEWYLSFEQETAWGCCSLGHIQENKGMFSRALSYYQRAFALANEEQKPELLLHKARVLMKMNQHNEAIMVYSGVNELNLQIVIALANAFFEGSYDEEAFVTYDLALKEYCTNDKQRIQLLMIMANVGYRLKGLRFGLNVMHQAERIQLASTHGRGFDIPFLKNYVFGKVYDGLVTCIMIEKLQDHVDDSMWWYHMGVNYLRGTNEYAKLACMCIQRAIYLGVNSEHFDVIGKMHAMISIAEFYGGDKDEAMEYAKRALNVYPDQPELWAVLILCIFSQRDWPYRVSWILAALYRVRRNLILSRPMKEWFRNLEWKLLRN